LIEIPRVFKPLFQPKRYKVFYGGRGSGKSTTKAIALLIIGKQKPTRILCAREIQTSIADSVHKLLKDMINLYPEFNDYEILQNVIRHPNGTEFIFKGLKHNTNDIKSTEGVDICWVEEAESVSEESWDILVPTIRKENSEIWITFNPKTETNPTYQRFVANADDDMIVVKVNYDQNPFFTETLRQEMERDRLRDYNKFLHIWEGEFQRLADACIFRNWKVEEFETPEFTQFIFGADWGFATDPNTLVRLFVKDRTIYIDYEAFGYGIEIEKTPELYDTIPEARRYIIRADNARPEMINYMKRAGFNITACTKWAGSVEDGIEHIKSYDVIIHPRCKNIAKEFSLYSYKTHRLTGDILPDIEDKNNHGIDAIRYAIEPLIKNRASLWANQI